LARVAIFSPIFESPKSMFELYVLLGGQKWCKEGKPYGDNDEHNQPTWVAIVNK
jgi:hypothetical protein